MRRNFFVRAVVLTLAAATVGASTGCHERIAAANLITLGAGWLLRDVTLTSSVERACYQNGVLIDCADLPEGLR